MTHYLKITSRHYFRIIKGEKTFEIRKNDRDFQVGDEIAFNADHTEPNYMQGAFNPSTHWRITYVFAGYGLIDGYVVLGIYPCVMFDEYRPGEV